MPLPLSQLEKKIGYTFKDEDLIKRALTHRSWAFENTDRPNENSVRSIENETLEFVGDSVVGLVVAEELFKNHLELSEGDLTLMKHHLVSTEMLAKRAKKIDLGSYLRVGHGEEKTGGRRKQALLANTFEALIAGVFFDGGYVAARTVIRRLMAEEFKSVTPKASLDYKTLLQETLQAEKLPAPVYNLLKSDGPSHKRVFEVEATWNDSRTVGTGSSIKSAEMQAASKALKVLGIEVND
jgi:ribonuclease-3